MATSSIGRRAFISLLGAEAAVPLVFHGSLDPVEFGLVASYSLPGGKMTGVTAFQSSSTRRRFELLDQINLNTARALGLNVPRTLLVAADEVSE